MLIRDDFPADDPWYQALVHDPHLASARENLEVMWLRFEPFADKHFESQILVDFHARFWELWLGNMLLDQGLELLAHSDTGPDLGAEFPCGGVLWIKAVTPGPGSGDDRVEERPSAGVSWVPTDKIVLRLRSSIEDKLRKIQHYLTSGLIKPEDMVVIAVNPRKIGFAVTDAEPSYALQCVYPIGAPYISLDRRTLAQVDRGYTFRPSITKKSGADVLTGIFTEARSAPVSALLFSLTDAYGLNLGLPQTVDDYSCHLVHNAMAANPLPSGALGARNQAQVTEQAEEWRLEWL